jgi:hypothetical protein
MREHGHQQNIFQVEAARKTAYKLIFKLFKTVSAGNPREFMREE